MTRLALSLAAAFVLTSAALRASAQPAAVPGKFAPPSNGSLIKMPLDRASSRTSGLWLHLDSRWANNYGYRPIQVTVNASKPAASDRTIKLRLRAQPFDPSLGSIQVEQEFELLAGSAAATMTMSLPHLFRLQWMSGQYVSWDVVVDGVRDRDLSREDNAGAVAFGVVYSAEAGLSMLTTGTSLTSRQSAISNSLEYEQFSLPPNEFPTRWLDYSCFDVITMTADELQLAGATNAAALVAFRQWTRAGGQLWVIDAGDGWQKLPTIERSLQLGSFRNTNATDDTEFSLDEVRQRGWKPAQLTPQDWSGRVVTFGDYSTGAQRVVRDPRTIDRLQRNGRYYIVSEQTVAPGRRAETNSSRWFVDQPIGLGIVRAFRGNGVIAMAPATSATQPAPPVNTTAPPRYRPPAGTSVVTSTTAAPTTFPELDAALETTLDWRARHGLVPDEPNPEFSDWLVPGVGLAPVTEFRVLITMFVILIGPVNYLFLKRYQRLHLLVITVPLAAILLTAALFSYALVADGLDTRVRVRSLTMLDQRAGEAASWARLSYYSGLAPGGGLVMASDTALYPIVARWQDSAGSELEVDRAIVWAGNDTQLTRGWLRSRTPTQYLAVRSRPSSARLQVRQGDGLLRVKNELDTEIRYVVVADADGKLFAGENLADDETADLTSIDAPTASGRFRLLLLDHQPQSPPALAGWQRNLVVSRPAYRPMAYAWQSSFGVSRLSENLMSEEIARWTTFDEQLDVDWRNRSYVAVTATSPEVQLGFDEAREEASFHVIVGRW